MRYSAKNAHYMATVFTATRINLRSLSLREQALKNELKELRLRMHEELISVKRQLLGLIPPDEKKLLSFLETPATHSFPERETFFQTLFSKAFLEEEPFIKKEFAYLMFPSQAPLVASFADIQALCMELQRYWKDSLIISVKKEDPYWAFHISVLF